MPGSRNQLTGTLTRLVPSGGSAGSGEESDTFLLHIEIQQGESLFNTQVLVPQDPYVSVQLPDGTCKRTKCVSMGGTDPEWNTSHGKHITLELSEENMPCILAICVWNENDGYLESDDLIGSAEATLQWGQLLMTEEQLHEGAHASLLDVTHLLATCFCHAFFTI